MTRNSTLDISESKELYQVKRRHLICAQGQLYYGACVDASSN